MGKIADDLNRQQELKDLYEEGRKDGESRDYHDKGPSHFQTLFGSTEEIEHKLENKEAYDAGYESKTGKK